MYSDLIMRGFKPENIILMSYSTALTAAENPLKGMIFTDPAETTDGDWAKYGCFDHIDYTDKDINGEVFLGILSGDAARVEKATGKKNPKVFSGGPEDTMFTYYIDHGSPDVIWVEDDAVRTAQVMEAMKAAYEKKLYGKWLWYIETCYSGSVFEKLPADWNVYVMTSADADHSAAMSNCPPDDVVAGKSLDTCIAGLWDNYWMEYAEKNPDTTVGELFDAVKARVAEESDQNVSEFGDMTFRDLPLAEFFGKPTTSTRARRATPKRESVVPIDQVPVHLAKWKAIREGSSNSLSALQKEVAKAAKQEVEVMRLGAALLSEKEADEAMKATTLTTSYSASCVSDLQIALHKECGHSTTPSKATLNLLRKVCAPGKIAPSMNWSEICM